MLSELNGTAGPRPGRVDLDWTWQFADGTGRPAHRLRRCRDSYPAERPGQAMDLVVTDGLFASESPAGTIVQLRYHAPTGRRSDPNTAPFATLTLRSAGPGAPWQAVVEYRERAGGPRIACPIADVTSIVHEDRPDAGWAHRDILRLRTSARTVAGTVVVRTGSAKPDMPNEWSWATGSTAPVRVSFDSTHVRRAAWLAGRAACWPANRPDGTPAPAPPPASTHLQVVEQRDPDTGAWHGEAHLADLTAAPGSAGYYELEPARGTGSGQPVRRVWAIATGEHGWAGRLYQQLPGIHRHLDEPEPDDRGAGQLRRFLAVIETMLDHLHGRAEALHSRHDVRSAQPEALPLLAGWIGWSIDRSAPLNTQRRDIERAPQLLGEVGTGPALRALVRRFTGVDCRIKEYAPSVFRTNAPQHVPLWELWQRAGVDATEPIEWGPASPLLGTARPPGTSGFDGRPAAARTPSGAVWRYFHADRTGSWRIWLLRHPDGSPELVPGAPAGDAGEILAEEQPAVAQKGATHWLIWSVRTAGGADLWARRTENGVPAAPVRLTYGAAARRPAASFDGTGRLWVFWESARSGRSDIWSRRLDQHGWSTPQRMTSGVSRDTAPAAVLDQDRLWLAWSAADDTGNQGTLWTRSLDGTSLRWGDAERLAATTAPQHDEAPCLVRWRGRLWAFWHSNRRVDAHLPNAVPTAGTRWRLWGSYRIDRDWATPFPVAGPDAGAPGLALDDKEPTAAVDAADRLLLTWRSQRRGAAFLSRTFDTRDTAARRIPGNPADPTHHLPDTRPGRPHNLTTVAVHLGPGGDPVYAATCLDPFRPANTAYLCLVEPDVTETLGGTVVATYSDELQSRTDRSERGKDT